MYDHRPWLAMSTWFGESTIMFQSDTSGDYRGMLLALIGEK